MDNCKCDCGEPVNSADADFLPGHDLKLRIQLEHQVGGLLSLKEFVHAAKRYSCGDASAEEFASLVRRVFAVKDRK